MDDEVRALLHELSNHFDGKNVLTEEEEALLEAINQLLERETDQGTTSS